MAQNDFSWAIPVMRAGYAGRGLVYVVVAGISLYAVWRGGQAEGTSSALATLETSAFGGVLLVLIFLGMVAYAIWRIVDAAWDLEDYGSDGEGIVARLGLVISGIIHAGIGVVAFSLLFGSGSEGQGSSIPRYVGMVMQWPGGRWIIGIGGLIAIGAGLFYVRKGWKEKYREHLMANHFTTRWNTALKAGVISQGVIVAIVGLLFVYAALQADPSEAGGVGQAFSWLYDQPYGRILVGVICVGLLGFALFCFVNAAYRIVPKASDPDIETLAARLT
jgi:hypothetical protein